jgi:hypothetical protein
MTAVVVDLGEVRRAREDTNRIVALTDYAGATIALLTEAGDLLPIDIADRLISELRETEFRIRDIELRAARRLAEKR